jgi:hypothetical protein
LDDTESESESAHDPLDDSNNPKLINAWLQSLMPPAAPYYTVPSPAAPTPAKRIATCAPRVPVSMMLPNPPTPGLRSSTPALSAIHTTYSSPAYPHPTVPNPSPAQTAAALWTAHIASRPSLLSTPAYLRSPQPPGAHAHEVATQLYQLWYRALWERVRAAERNGQAVRSEGYVRVRYALQTLAGVLEKRGVTVVRKQGVVAQKKKEVRGGEGVMNEVGQAEGMEQGMSNQQLQQKVLAQQEKIRQQVVLLQMQGQREQMTLVQMGMLEREKVLARNGMAAQDGMVVQQAGSEKSKGKEIMKEMASVLANE